MLSFANDYNVGACKEILDKLTEINGEKISGYGLDHYTYDAKSKIKNMLKNENADIYFLVGGTETNQVVISTMLKTYGGIISASSGHIATHEAGAIEYTGHKVLELPEHDGKIDADELKNYLADFYNDDNHIHMVVPEMVYITFPTEYGTLYTKSELEKIYSICKEYKLTLYIDGARLGYGLMSDSCDIKFSDISNLCDCFYIGGTKVGALFGEAVVFTHNNAPENFYTMTKQHGAMLAKGWLLAVQFSTLFTDDLYFKFGKNAIDRAAELKEIFKEKGYKFFINSTTNQMFVIMENGKINELKKSVAVSLWSKYDDTHSVVRFVTSFATTKEEVIELKKLL